MCMSPLDLWADWWMHPMASHPMASRESPGRHVYNGECVHGQQSCSFVMHGLVPQQTVILSSPVIRSSQGMPVLCVAGFVGGCSRLSSTGPCLSHLIPDDHRMNQFWILTQMHLFDTVSDHHTACSGTTPCGMNLVVNMSCQAVIPI